MGEYVVGRELTPGDLFDLLKQKDACIKKLKEERKDLIETLTAVRGLAAVSAVEDIGHVVDVALAKKEERDEA